MGISLNRLRERVRVEQRVVRGDLQGGYQETWVDQGTFWATVTPQRVVTQRYAQDIGQQLHALPAASLTYQVIMRSQTAVTSEARLIWRNKILSLIGEPLLDYAQGTLEFTAVEVKGAPSSVQEKKAHYNAI